MVDSSPFAPSRNTNPKRQTVPYRGLSRQGAVRIARREYLGEIKNTDGVNAWGNFKLDPITFPWLKNIAKNFERVKWHSCMVLFKPCLSATTSGSIIYGVDWDSQVAESVIQDYEHISALTPVCEAPIWQASSLTLPSSRLQTRKEYNLNNKNDYDAMPAYIMYTSSGQTSKTVYGHMWVEYDLSFFGTNKA